MKKSLLLFLLIMPFGFVTAQNNGNFGIFGGASYYLGDINPQKQFYNPLPSFGIFYRYNINPRYAVRLNGYYVSLSGSDVDFPESVHPDRVSSPAIFNTALIDAALQVEFNFLPYMPNQNSLDFTPYIATGIAGGLILMTDVDSRNFISLPMSMGIKTTFTRRISGGIEWAFRKTFNDRLDGLENPSGVLSNIHNNDWYSFIGVFITYKFFNFAVDCPAYD